MNSQSGASTTLACPRCGARNRVEVRRWLQAVCGRCGYPLSALGEHLRDEARRDSYGRNIGTIRVGPEAGGPPPRTRLGRFWQALGNTLWNTVVGLFLAFFIVEAVVTAWFIATERLSLPWVAAIPVCLVLTPLLLALGWWVMHAWADYCGPRR